MAKMMLLEQTEGKRVAEGHLFATVPARPPSDEDDDERFGINEGVNGDVLAAAAHRFESSGRSNKWATRKELK